jgi:peptidoglycan/LPS O-acetylase OafA/YrhL
MLFLLGKPSEKMPGKPRGRIGLVDFARGVAILAVIAVHASNSVAEAKGLNGYLGFGVEIFVLTSGYLLARRYAASLDLKEYFGKIFLRVALIYALFVLATYLLSGPQAFSLQNLALDFLLGAQNGNGYYFIPVILQLYLVFPLVRKIGWGRKSIALLFALLAATIIWSSIDAQLRKPDWNSDPLALAFAGRYAFLFALGIFLANYALEKLPAAKSAAIAACYVLLAALASSLEGTLFLGYLYPAFVLFAIGAAYSAFAGLRLADSIRSLIEPLGKQSLLIYLLHGAVLYGLLAPLLPAMEWQERYAALIALTAALSFAVSEAFMAAYSRLTGYRSV